MTTHAFVLPVVSLLSPLVAGCYSGSLENRPCGPDGGCLPGYVCSTAGVCVASDSAPPSALQYSVTPAVYTKGLTISPNTPTASGGPATRYAVWPALPDGIALDASSGVISGTPAAITPVTPYTVTAANAAGEATTVITIAVNDIAPSDLRYSTNPVIYTKGIPSPANWPVSAGGDVVAYQLSPELPAGLRFDVTTGIITGTPRDVSAPAAYAVTATNSGGSAGAVLTISVNPAVNNAGDGAAPANLSYRDNPAVFTKGVAIEPARPSATAGPATAFSISPLLPGGLLLNGVTGVISGVPTEVSPATTYVVTASNSAGSTTVALTLTVRDAAPQSLTYALNPATYTKGRVIPPNTPSTTGGVPTGYAVAPALPSGLALDAVTGAMTGTPTVAISPQSYVVTASNPAGEATVALTLGVEDIAPVNLAYSNNPAIYLRGEPISFNTPTNAGGTPAWYSVSPALPAQLDLNASTGIISGTPVSLAGLAAYTVTAGNDKGSTSVVVAIAIEDASAAPKDLQYSTNPATYTKGVAVPPNSAITAGGAPVSYAVSPSLPAGLILDTSTGVISGTPAAVEPSQRYTVTALNASGSASTTLTITINDAPPAGLRYAFSLTTYVRGLAIHANEPTSNGGTPTAYIASPALPAGLSLNPSTGVISGTPSAISPATPYVVTASNPAGKATASVTIAVTDTPPVALTYKTSPAIYMKDIPISPNTPTIGGGGAVVNYAVSPALPAHLTLDATTGAISGTPTVATDLKYYVVTAENTGGTTSATLAIAVNDVPPTNLTYSTNPAVYTKGIITQPNTPSNTGGTVVSYSISPMLPPGLGIDPSTGVISGTPTTITTTATHAVTATNSGGSTGVVLTITVNDVPPSNLRYSTNPATHRAGSPIAPNGPTNDGGAVVSFSVAPALPAGLSLSAATGVISGSPTFSLTAARTTSHTVTANNSGGSASTNLSITIAPQLGTNDSVHAIAMGANGTVYFGGHFTQVGPATGGGVPLDASTGAAAALPAVAGFVNAVVADGAGGWYLGGAFSGVGGIPRSNLAHILADGTIDAAWAPNADLPVRALAVSGGTVYAGGSFTTVGGLPRNHLAAIDASGAVTPWSPNTDAAIHALALSGTTVYVGGDFTTLGGVTRNRLAAIDASGAITSWSPNADSAVRALAVTGSIVYVGGDFATMGGVARNHLAAIDASGTIAPWNPSADAAVRALAVSGSAVYVGGDFATVGGVARNRLAAIDASGAVTSWNPNADAAVRALAASGSTVYAGGEFTTVGGVTRNRLAAFDATGAVTSWNPNAGAPVRALAASGSTVYAGGEFTTVGGVTRNRLAATDASGDVTSWDPNASGNVWALSVSGNTVYAGGEFSTVGGLTRNFLVAIDVSGAVSSWNPNPTSAVEALAVGDGTVYVGGRFTTVGGLTRNALAAIDSSGSVTSWNPNPNSRVCALALSGSTVYAGGEFTTAGGAIRNHLAAFDATGAVTSWDPNANARVCALAVSGDTVYAGGSFTALGGLTRNALAAIDSSGSVTSWNPNANDSVWALAASGGTVYVGGEFTTVGDLTRKHLAGIESSGAVTSWSPNASDSVWALTSSGSTVYAGGWFAAVGAQPAARIGRISQ